MEHSGSGVWRRWSLNFLAAAFVEYINKNSVGWFGFVFERNDGVFAIIDGVLPVPREKVVTNPKDKLWMVESNPSISLAYTSNRRLKMYQNDGPVVAVTFSGN